MRYVTGLILIATSLLLTGCPKSQKPNVFECVFNGPSLFCVNHKTKEEKEVSIEEANEKAYLAMSPDDRKGLVDWYEQRCRK
jgi:hypothetical protein